METKKRIVVLGSINMDLVAQCATLPQAGETLTCNRYGEVFGGKGANQAIASARAGGEVQIIGRLGDDLFANRLRENLLDNGVDCSAVTKTAGYPSGLALIVVADDGENQIVVVPGANGQVTTHDVDQFSQLISKSNCLLLQLEVPLPAVAHAICLAKKCGVRIILDPAPAPSGSLPNELYQVDLICPNETEARRLTQVPDESILSMEAAARILYDRGCKQVAITLGKSGTLLFDGQNLQIIESIPIVAVDTTGAGDAFAGALAVKWAETNDLPESIRWANIAGALSASRPGAQSGIATRREIEQACEQTKEH